MWCITKNVSSPYFLGSWVDVQSATERSQWITGVFSYTRSLTPQVKRGKPAQCLWEIFSFCSKTHENVSQPVSLFLTTSAQSLVKYPFSTCIWKSSCTQIAIYCCLSIFGFKVQSLQLACNKYQVPRHSMTVLPQFSNQCTCRLHQFQPFS